MLDKKRKRIEELKDICKSILDDEKRNYGVEVASYPITIVEYYNRDEFRQQTALQQLKGRFDLRNTGGYFSSKNDQLFVFIDKMGKGQKIYSDNKLAAVILATYHEFKHKLQYNDYEKSSGAYMIFLAEEMIKRINADDYLKRHEEYFMEIDANIYGVDKTRKYLQEHYPSQYERAREYLDDKEFKAKHNLNNFDYQALFDDVYRLANEKYILLASFVGFDVFFDYYNCFNDLSEIMNCSDLATFDEKVVCGILGSKSFLEQLSDKKLSEKEKQFMSEIFNTILVGEIKRMEQNTTLYSEGKIKVKEYLSLCNVILEKTSFLKEKSLVLGLDDVQVPNNLINRDWKMLKK